MRSRIGLDDPLSGLYDILGAGSGFGSDLRCADSAPIPSTWAVANVVWNIVDRDFHPTARRYILIRDSNDAAVSAL